MLLLLWTLFEIYQWFLIARVILSWFPDYSQTTWYLWIASITDPYLNIFRGWIPLVAGGLDLSPMIAFFVLQWVRSLLESWIIRLHSL